MTVSRDKDGREEDRKSGINGSNIKKKENKKTAN